MKTEDDEMEMMALREQALKSLITNAKRSTAGASSVASSESAPRISNNPPSYPVHDQRPMPIQPQHNTMQPHIYNGNNSSSYGARPFINSQYPGYHPQGFQPINPMMPVVQPHVNVNFHPIPFNPAHPLPMNGGGTAVPMEAHKYEPTPPARLSPRSAQFVAANEAAMRNSGQRVKRRSRSSSRSRSRSPRYKKRSRSPHIDHIARKRRDAVGDERLRQQQWPKGPRARPYQKGNQRNFFDKNNRQPFRKSPDADKAACKASTQPETHQEKEDKNGNEPERPKTTVEKPAKVEQKPRERTKEEIEEDELLKSSDDEEEEGNGDEISLMIDDNELDFLDDDEEESEGRFKSKPTTAQVVKPKPTFNKFNDKFNNNNRRNNTRTYDSSRNNGNRRSRSPFRHQKKSDYSAKTSFRDKPDMASLTIATSNGSSSSNSTAHKANKESTTKSTKSTVSAPAVASSSSSSSVKTSVKDDSQKPSVSDNRIRLNRNKIPSRVEMVKPSRSDSDNATTAATGKSEKAIMKRLGGFVGEKPSSWPQNQAT